MFLKVVVVVTLGCMAVVLLVGYHLHRPSQPHRAGLPTSDSTSPTFQTAKLTFTANVKSPDSGDNDNNNTDNNKNRQHYKEDVGEKRRGGQERPDSFNKGPKNRLVPSFRAHAYCRHIIMWSSCPPVVIFLPCHLVIYLVIILS